MCVASSPAVLSTVSADRDTKMRHSFTRGTAIVDKCKSYCIAMRLGPTPAGAAPEFVVLGDGGRPGPSGGSPVTGVKSLCENRRRFSSPRSLASTRVRGVIGIEASNAPPPPLSLPSRLGARCVLVKLNSATVLFMLTTLGLSFGPRDSHQRILTLAAVALSWSSASNGQPLFGCGVPTVNAA